MVRSYYYIVSGLHDLWPDETKLPITLQEIKEELDTQIAPQEQKTVHSIFLAWDNQTLLSLLDKTKKEPQWKGNFSIDFLESQLKEPEELPEYMQQFLYAYHAGEKTYPVQTNEDQLTWHYYNTLLQINNNFLKEYFLFDLNLRNYTSLLNCKVMGISPQNYIIGTNEAAHLMRAGKTGSTELGDLFLEADKLNALWDNTEPMQREKQLDIMRWDKMEELNSFNYFSVEIIYAYLLKLSILERWTHIQSEQGIQIFHELVERMRTLDFSALAKQPK